MLGDRDGEKRFSRESSHRPLAVASSRHRAVYEQKKFRTCRRIRRNDAGAAAGVRSNVFIVLPFPYELGIRRLQEGPVSDGWSRTVEAGGRRRMGGGDARRHRDHPEREVKIDPRPDIRHRGDGQVPRGRVTVMGQPSGLVTRFTTRIPPGLRRSGPRRHINQPDRDVPSRSPTVPSSASAPVRRAKAGPP
jgi:hypothetical protein